MNCVSITAVTASAISAAKPRQRDSATTAIAKIAASSNNGFVRSWSTYWYRSAIVFASAGRRA